MYETATKPDTPDFPKPMSWAILGSLAVLLIALAFVYGREELVGRFHSGDAQRVAPFRRPRARVLPDARGKSPRGTVTGAATTVDEVGLQFVHLLGRNKPNVVLLCGVDGAAPEETARRIAQAVAESGVRVVYSACRGIAVDDDDSEEFEAPVPRARLSVVQDQQTGGRLRVLDDGISVNELTVLACPFGAAPAHRAVRVRRDRGGVAHGRARDPRARGARGRHGDGGAAR